MCRFELKVTMKSDGIQIQSTNQPLNASSKELNCMELGKINNNEIQFGKKKKTVKE